MIQVPVANAKYGTALIRAIATALYFVKNMIDFIAHRSAQTLYRHNLNSVSKASRFPGPFAILLQLSQKNFELRIFVVQFYLQKVKINVTAHLGQYCVHAVKGGKDQVTIGTRNRLLRFATLFVAGTKQIFQILRRVNSEASHGNYCPFH